MIHSSDLDLIKMAITISKTCSDKEQVFLMWYLMSNRYSSHLRRTAGYSLQSKLSEIQSFAWVELQEAILNFNIKRRKHGTKLNDKGVD